MRFEQSRLSTALWFAFYVQAVGCGQPDCPSGTYREGNVCKAGHAPVTSADASPDVPATGHTTSGATGMGDPMPSEPSTEKAPLAGQGGASVRGGSGGAGGATPTIVGGAGGATPTIVGGTGGQPSRICKPNEHKCTGATLETCAADGQSYIETDCKSPELCQAGQGVCSTAVCQAGQYTCDKDVLKQCNPGLTDWEVVQACSPGLCSAIDKACRQCMPSERKCQADTVMTCNAHGLDYSATSCGAATPHCVGAGNCVQCSIATADKDCSKACQHSSCSTAGACQYTPSPELEICHFAPNTYEGFCRAGACSRPTSANGHSKMYRGEALYPGEALINGTYRLTFQTDGNLVLWNGSTFVWHLFDVQPGTPPGELVMQPDGNLVIYNAQGVYQWSALNQVGDGSYVWVQTDRNVCLYDSSNNPLWCTMTQGM